VHPHSRLAIPISDMRGSSGIAGYINEMETLNTKRTQAVLDKVGRWEPGRNM